MKPDKAVLLRTVALLVAWVNMILTARGWSVLPFSEAEVADGVSFILAFAATLWAWWKNNSVSPEARLADEYMHALKAHNKEESE